jgi:hypothetical protein
MYGSVLSCASLHSYSQAKRHFERRGPVRSRRWSMDQRPLSGTRQQWFRVVQGGMDDYFDLVLYQTPMVRYYKPEESGDYTVLLRGEGHSMSWQFLDNAGWATWRRPVLTSAGKRVMVPLNTRTGDKYGIVPHMWSAKLRFNERGSLILGESDHRPVFVSRAAASDREIRRVAREKLNPIVDAMMFLIPQLHENSVVSWSRGRAFGSMENRGDAWHAGQLIRETIREGGELPEQLSQHLRPYAQELYNVVLSKSLVANPPRNPASVFPYRGRDDADGGNYPQLTEERFRASLLSSMIREAGLNTASKQVPLPKFLDKLPRKFFSAGH